MKILVAGGAGFIGSNFIRWWLKNHPDDHIINFDKLTYAGNKETLKDIPEGQNYEFVQGDIVDDEAVWGALDGVEVVVNFAAESHVDRSISDPAIFVKTNVLGTQVLLENALKKGVARFHHVSTDEVFGSLALDSKEKFTEDTPYKPNSPYAASKAASDHLVRAYHHTFGLPITISNCSNNFGPWQYPEKVISLAITNLIEGKKVPIYGDGLYVRDWLYVLDHCSAIGLILQKGKAGETYNIGASNEIPNIELAKKILNIMGAGEDMIEYVKDRPGHDRRYAIDATKIKEELGWKPEADFDDELRSTVEWYRANKVWWKKLKNDGSTDS